jgi:hypothetical protein
MHDTLHCLVWPWKLKEAAQASIIEELEPKVAVIDAASKLNLGDQINGKQIEGFATKAFSPARVEPDSGRHRGQFTEASGFVYCEVRSTYYVLPLARLLLLPMGLV